jgi:hypothetical protein
MLTRSQIAAIEHDPAVVAVVPDSPVELMAQSVPTGVTRIGTLDSPVAVIDGTDERVDVDVAIIDTGIQADHPDLNVVGGYDCSTSNPAAWPDDHGHGTHVAGIVGALDNTIGVVGVAPGARLWSVKVFKRDSAGKAVSKISWIVCGIDWITAQRDPDDPSRPLIEVANMSLRDAGGDDGNCGYTNNDIEHQAICRSVASGTTYFAAAGNDGTSTTGWRPSSYDEVITVSALADYDGLPGGLASATCTSFGVLDVDDALARFSNYGKDVDLIAPGVCIRSTWRGSTYLTISGTSMATPTAAGAGALYIAAHPGASPAEVRLALRAAGSLDWRTWTDRDTTNEPLVDASSFGAGPGLGVSAPRDDVRVWAGGPSSSTPVKVVRKDAFAGQVALAMEGVPAGVTATLSQSSFSGWSVGPAKLVVTAAAGTPAGTTPTTFVATSGGLEARQTINLVVERDEVAPIATLTSESIVAPQTLTTAGVTVRTTWAGSDEGSGIVRFDLRERRSTGAWKTVLTTSGSVLTRSARLPISTVLRHRIRSTDAVGNAGAWTDGPAFTISTWSEKSALLTYKKTWKTQVTSSARGGRLRYATAANASVTLRVTASSVAWLSTVGPKRGKAKVYLDGVLVKTVDCYAKTITTKRIVFATDLTPGPHELRIVVAGTSGRPRVDVDGFVVIR